MPGIGLIWTTFSVLRCRPILKPLKAFWEKPYLNRYTSQRYKKALPRNLEGSDRPKVYAKGTVNGRAFAQYIGGVRLRQFQTLPKVRNRREPSVL